MSEATLDFDLRRTIILGDYIKAWGMPESRFVTSKGAQRIETYYFPPHQGVVGRFATVGVSDYMHPDGTSTDWEFLMVLPDDNAGACIDAVAGFLFDVMAATRHSGARLSVGSTIDESPIAPASWKAKALLFDTPRGEPEFLERFHYVKQCIQLFWLIPIYKSERDAIVAHGLDRFDAADQASEWSLVDPLRDALIDAQ